MDWQNFLPSARAVALRKTLWQKAGRFPEFLTLTGEDTLFDIEYRRVSTRWAVNKRAAVYWQAPTSLEAADTLAFRYGVGDGESRFGDFLHYAELLRHWRQPDAAPTSQHARGYLQGRTKRADLEVNRREVSRLLVLFSAWTIVDPRGLRDVAIRAVRAGYKVVHVSPRLATVAEPELP